MVMEGRPQPTQVTHLSRRWAPYFAKPAHNSLIGTGLPNTLIVLAATTSRFEAMTYLRNIVNSLGLQWGCCNNSQNMS
jgi:hypothetical protein